MNAEDTEYVRTVTRKTFSAAVARIYRPGIKFDSLLVLDGEQGIGKSSLFRELVGEEYFSDSLQLSYIDGKTAAEKIQGSWIIEIAELAGMKKAEIEKVKAFLSSSDDKYRPSYGKVVESHPRSCILVATVNGQEGYLRDITGNRRFWIVKLKQTEQKKEYDISSDEKDQIWAEAKYYYENGEKLYLENAELIKAAAEVQKEALETDERLGMVELYLEKLLPDNWDSLDLYDRRVYLSEYDNLGSQRGTTPRQTVSNAEIWCECFGKNLSDMQKKDSFALAGIMAKIKGWEKRKTANRISLYGLQRLYSKIC